MPRWPEARELQRRCKQINAEGAVAQFTRVRYASHTFRISPTPPLYSIFDVLKTRRLLNRYQAPFDRHDWVIERCGQRIHYVIDYYTGRANGGGPFAFHIDARPALDSWEGIRMRVTRFFSTVWRNTTTSSGGAVPPTPSVPRSTSARG